MQKMYTWKCRICGAQSKGSYPRYKAKLRAREHAKRNNEPNVDIYLYSQERNWRSIHFTEELNPRIISKNIYGSVRRFVVNKEG